ncbi:MAG: restriction endonuclease [Candidatus Edwardsbacteria bacterium]
MPSLSGIKSKDTLKALYVKTYPDAKKMTIANEVGQLWTFISRIKKEDLVALPLKKQASIAIGRIEDEGYQYKKLADNVKHIRRVKWLKIIPRTAFDQNLLYSLGAFMTVCEIKRDEAENKVLKLLKKEMHDPADKPKEDIESEEQARIDIEQSAQDEIVKYIDQKFKGHALSRLVEAILKAQGYTTLSSDPGPDGGVDILAGAGPLGFDNPKICVQVKSASSPSDTKVISELGGVMQKKGAQQGLFVSWGGYNTKAWREAKDIFFSIRLWHSGDLIKEIFKHYDKFDDELKAELPLKRIWALVAEE